MTYHIPQIIHEARQSATANHQCHEECPSQGSDW